ncbi:inosine/uridine-preferring nucleoside hydrolase [Mytilinidion resinicola]|uniref:Inosine/uridine-preferring nucleoside hydrolase n=1 Tax=Mytilinidion resinicola TaxID=574789 RepID=A0A6A6Z960_9PEZI|nr:inosine/uridine-preferring nucleoside hydrolase [Mytilinidion resinicola]KAF2817662.1 inosine/uridine-preferring nucleoside hydrolase [Mytilinidion resinicola]
MLRSLDRCYQRLVQVTLIALSLMNPIESHSKNLIIDTDIFSDVDDAGALLLASTLPHVNILAVNVNYPSSYSALAASAILAYYGHANVPIGLRRPITNESFFDDWAYELGEYTSKVAYHWSNGTLPWGNASKSWEPVELYRKTLACQEDRSVTIASIGFLENLSALLNSTADEYSQLSGRDLIAIKVKELVVMGGGYPSGYEFNFFGDDPGVTAHAVNNWPGSITFSGTELGGNVSSGARLTVEAPSHDPVAAAYGWYIGYNNTRFSWDPLTVLYAISGLGEWFEYGNGNGYNFVYPNGSNEWVYDEERKDQHWLNLAVSNVTVAQKLDKLLLDGAGAV